ncbi:Cytochrome oxidase biogenesis protein Sco1/SenC/PrrC, thiol-disulfide reductase involved in Cu(I) insertion into CoxII Cu(A) center [hydrothermal vent metagenome]|uniref:Cytochrome oxidase biogenesis protein Sco1/SenC/PrrC, thiol-disulfide reductase involved in Cu(I) insertion into CoxII Cu(A) center n=1 Tax=hydrothermal vent metagenome TaxID=652676 RepID=A0A3B1BTY7_9ZZZZ
MDSGSKTLRLYLPILLAITCLALLMASLLNPSLINLFQPTPQTPITLTIKLLPKPVIISNLHLLDAQNHAFTLERLQDHWSLIYFGYMNCPDVCPATLSIMQQVWRQLREQKADMTQFQLVFVSVDPDRDQPQQLQEYAGYFDPSFIGISGDANEIDNFTRQTDIKYGFEDEDETGNYAVNHSTRILLLDPQARLRAFLSSPFDSKSITHDLLAIQQYYGVHS